ncbi:MAG: hypothetical protein GY723_11950 [bacterium]|nr:hypothetical protein [bacterium]
MRWLPVAAFLILLVPSLGLAEWLPTEADWTRPRILSRPGDIPELQDRLEREPYRTLFDQMLGRAMMADGILLDDHGIEAQRFKARAAKVRAFLYALDRTRIDNAIVPFPSPAARQAEGDRVRDWLLHLYPRSRIAVPPPLGGSDRDISTSEELLQFATAYDTLKGAGYAFDPDDEAEIVDRLVALASELFLNYRNPETAGGYPNMHQNNHRSKTGMSLVVAAMALAEYAPAPGTDPDAIRDPADWVVLGLDLTHTILRDALVTGDGAYAEGPFYLRFTHQNWIPFARTWDRLFGGAVVSVGERSYPSLWRHPVTSRQLRWLLDMTLPDGSLVPQDDANVGRSHYFGAYPTTHPDAAAFAWRWANAPSPFETDGNVDLGPDAIAIYDDGITPAAPTDRPNAFYPEGGNAIFRSAWSEDAVVAVVQAEHDVASLFGRDRDGNALFPQSHEHAEPGAFLLHAYGERLALDPGYLSFDLRSMVGKPQDHSIILVDGQGPFDYLSGTLLWATAPDLRPPVDGHAILTDLLDAEGLAAARVITRYGAWSYAAPSANAPRIDRRFLFLDGSLLLIADSLDAEPGQAHDFTWQVHGNGGGTSGGSYQALPHGGRWTRAQARLDAGFDDDGAGAPTFSTRVSNHEGPGKASLTHDVLEATSSGSRLRSLLLLAPSPSHEGIPTLTSLDLVGAAGIRLDQPASDRRLIAVHRRARGPALLLPTAATGLPETEVSANLAIFDAHTDGSLRHAIVEGGGRLAFGGVTYLETPEPGFLSIRLHEQSADLVVDASAHLVDVKNLPFLVAGADGVCGFTATPAGARVVLGSETRFKLRAAPGNARPAADPGPDRRANVGELLTLDSTWSCDADGDPLSARWRLLSAPPGSEWLLSEADTKTPTLAIDRPGPFRVELVVTDPDGNASLAREVRIVAGEACSDAEDGDLDGWIDSDDPDCDMPAPVCQNGLDDDGDGWTDFPDDPGCAHPLGQREDPPCDDGLDNDLDGATDAADARCAAGRSETESPGVTFACGLGFEVAGALALLAAARRAARRIRS